MNLKDYIKDAVKTESIVDSVDVNTRLLHGVIGLITEAGELSEAITETPSLARAGHFPDVDAVQIIAYARLIKYRRLLDNLLDQNKYWSRNRTPVWCAKYVNYQAPELSDLQLVSQINI